MDMLALYDKVLSKIASIDFSSLFPGFHPFLFALYNKELAILDGKCIEKPEAFMANTAIFFDNAYVAIWQVTEPMDVNVLASKIIHEMFHAYQHEQKEKRFADELEALLTLSPTAHYYTLLYEENQCLLALSQEANEAAFNRFCALRKARYQQYQAESLYQAKIEQIEGMAQYVEWKALSLLDPSFYQKTLARKRENLLSTNALFHQRILSYDTGAFLASYLSNHGLLDASFDQTPFSFKIILESLEPVNVKTSQEIRACYEAKQDSINQVIKQALDSNLVVVEEDFQLLGVNVYDAIRLDNYLVLTYFLMMKRHDETEVLQGDFLVVMDGITGKKVYKRH